MKSVGLRELKNRLGVYIRRVQDGETLAITDRGKIIAELVPLRPENDPTSALKSMARRGEMTLAEPRARHRRPALYKPLPRTLKKGATTQDLLDADRGER